MVEQQNEGSDSTSLTELLDRSFKNFADFPAITHEGTTVTYSQLESRVDSAARSLVINGIESEQIVAIDMPRSLDYIVWLLATVKAGGCYLALDVNQSSKKRADLLDRFPKHLRLRGSDTEVRCDEVTTPLPMPETDSSSAACVVFTSGTTSIKKAITLEHGNISWFATNSSIPSLSPGKAMCQIASPDFDTFIFEVWRSLACGSELKILPSFPELVSRGLAKELKRNKVHAMLAPATVLNRLAYSEPEAFAHLELLCSGGDVLRPETPKLIKEAGFSGVFMNLYGPTETTVACTGHVITGKEIHTIPIGTALSGVSLSVVGIDGHDVSSGGVGALVVSGNGVARGYVDNAASSFATDIDGRRVYDTGDIVEVNADGELEFRGRNTGWIKIDGSRVELSEIEDALLAAGAREAAVVAVGEEGMKRLAGFVVADSTHTVRSFRAALTNDLPKQAVPSDLRIVEKMPIDANGKRDLTLLQKEYSSMLQNRRTYVEPRNDIDTNLIAIWEELLGVENITIEDDFFALGGHSLLAVKHRARVQKHWKCNIPAETMFEITVLREFSDFLTESLIEKDGAK